MKTQTFNYEIAPKKTASRKERDEKVVFGTLVASNYGSATQLASQKAIELSKKRGEEYGLVRIW